MKPWIVILTVLCLNVSAYAQAPSGHGGEVTTSNKKDTGKTQGPKQTLAQATAWTCTADCPGQKGSIPVPGFNAPGRLKNKTRPVEGKNIPVAAANNCVGIGESANAAARALDVYLQSMKGADCAQRCRLLSGSCVGPNGEKKLVSEVYSRQEDPSTEGASSGKQ